MKRMWKCALALLCALTMVASGIVPWNGQVAEAEEAEQEALEWHIVDEAITLTTNNTSTTDISNTWVKDDLNLDLSGSDKTETKLSITLNIPEDHAVLSGTRFEFFLCQSGEPSQSNRNPYSYNFYMTQESVQKLRAGEHTYEFQWGVARDDNGVEIYTDARITGSEPSWNDSMEWCGIYVLDTDWKTKLSMDDVTINEIKIVGAEKTETTKETREWVVTDEAETLTSCTYKSWSYLNFDLSAYTAEDLTLSMTMNIPEGHAVLSGVRLELFLKPTGGSNENAYMFKVTPTSVLKAGKNTIEWSFADTTAWENVGTGTASLENGIEEVTFRVRTNWTGTFCDLEDITVSEIKIENTVPTYIVDVDEAETLTTCTEKSWSDLNLNLSAYTAEDLTLSMTLNIPEGHAVLSGVRLELFLRPTENSNDNAYMFKVTPTDVLKAGENTIEWSFADFGTAWENWGNGTASLANGIKQVTFKVRTDWSTYGDLKGITVKEIKIEPTKPTAPTEKSVVADIVDEAETLTSCKEKSWSDLNLDLSAYTAEDLTLSMTMNIPEDHAVLSGVRLELFLRPTKNSNDNAYMFKVTPTDVLKAGENTIEWSFADFGTAWENWGNGTASLANGIKQVTFKVRAAWGSPANYGDLNGITVSDIQIVGDVCAPYVIECASPKAGRSPFKAGLSYYEIPEDYVFAGWYTDSQCKTEHALGDTVEGTTYAKFVSGGLQDVKAQYTTDAASTNTNKGILRFISTVDSLQYQEVGFNITIGENSVELPSTTVYETIYAVGSAGETITYKPSAIDTAARYFNAILFENVPTDEEITVTVKSYWVTQDGTQVYGEPRTITVTITE